MADDAAKDQPLVPFRFKPGQSGNPKGRPIGTRIKLAESFLRDILADWEESGLIAIQQLRKKNPEAYVKVIADMLPKAVNVSGEVLHDHQHRAVSETAAWIAGLLGERPDSAPPQSLPN